jgi:hypothetical protein
MSAKVLSGEACSGTVIDDIRDVVSEYGTNFQKGKLPVRLIRELEYHFGLIPDYRMGYCVYLLVNIIIIAVLAILTGARLKSRNMEKTI